MAFRWSLCLIPGVRMTSTLIWKKKKKSCLCKLAKSRFTVDKGLLLMRCITDISICSVYFMVLFPVFMLVFCTAGYCSVKHVNWCCFSGFAGSLVLDAILFFFYSFLISSFPCMQSRFIQIKYCSNMLIIPELLFGFWCLCKLGGSSRRSAAFCFCRVLLDLWITM